MEFNKILKQVRESKKMSQADLAKLAGLKPAAISHFETGQRSPSFDNLKKLADALNVSTDYLMGRIDEPEHGKGIASAPRAKQLFRHMEKMSEESFSILEMMAKNLANKGKTEDEDT